jgi:hypothetical protein
MKIRNLTAHALTAAMAISPVFAGNNLSAAASSPLSAGRPAGTKQAALEGDTWKVAAGLVLIGALIAVGASSGGSKGSATTGTSS